MCAAGGMAPAIIVERIDGDAALAPGDEPQQAAA
jgi:hypothetical protein